MTYFQNIWLQALWFRRIIFTILHLKKQIVQNISVCDEKMVILNEVCDIYTKVIYTFNLNLGINF